MSATLIRRLEFRRLDIPLHVPFGISGGAQAVANNVLVELELANGVRGYGEAAPLPPYNGETQADALRALESVRAAVSGRDVRDWERIAGEFPQASAVRSGSAQCALEMAMLDALTRTEGKPLWQFFGGAGTELETDMTVTTGSPAEAADAARDIRRRGIRVIKVKVGGAAGPAHDAARLGAIRDVAPESPLILDGNAGLSGAQASDLVRRLKAAGITPALLEQWLPKDDLAGLRRLHEESGWTVAADESVSTAAEAERVADAGAAQVVNIKLMKAGVAEALRIVAVARRRGLGLMIGGNVESMLAMSFSAAFAAGLGGFGYADLDTPLFLAENPFDGGYQLSGGVLSVRHVTAGHGVVPRRIRA